MPWSAPPSTGIPTTGSRVWAATAPAKWAAPPAAAMMTPKPSCSARSVNSATKSGVRWALITRTTVSTPSFLKVSMHP